MHSSESWIIDYRTIAQNCAITEVSQMRGTVLIIGIVCAVALIGWTPAEAAAPVYDETIVPEVTGYDWAWTGWWWWDLQADAYRFDFPSDPYLHSPWNLEVKSATLTLWGEDLECMDEADIYWLDPGTDEYMLIGQVSGPQNSWSMSFDLDPSWINGNVGELAIEQKSWTWTWCQDSDVLPTCYCCPCDDPKLTEANLHVEHTPELPASALLMLSSLPLGVAYLRGRRRRES